jgi:hypothetical protein
VRSLQVTFKIGLAHPIIAMYGATAPLQVTYRDTGNTVFIDPPGVAPNTDARLGALDLLTIRVRR